MDERKSKRYKTNSEPKATSSSTPANSSGGSNPTGSSSSSAPRSGSGGGTTTSRGIKFTNFHKAIFQIFSSLGCLLDSELKAAVNNIKGDFEPQELVPITSIAPGAIVTDAELRSLFSLMNSELRKLHFEIKTIAIRKNSRKSDQGLVGSSSSAPMDELTIYHGLVNTFDDKVAELEGNKMTAKDTALFKAVVERLIVMKKLSTKDIHIDVIEKNEEMKKLFLKVSQSAIEEVLERLIEERWLDRNDKKYIVIGARTYLELKSVLETMIENANEDEGVVAALKSELPQVLIY